MLPHLNVYNLLYILFDQVILFTFKIINVISEITSVGIQIHGIDIEYLKV